MNNNSKKYQKIKKIKILSQPSNNRRALTKRFDDANVYKMDLTDNILSDVGAEKPLEKQKTSKGISQIPQHLLPRSKK